MDLIPKMLRFIIFLCPVFSSLFDKSNAVVGNCGYCSSDIGKVDSPICAKCFCDLDCLTYGDCCSDFLTKFDLRKSKLDPSFSCVDQNRSVYRFDDLDINYGYYMTTSHQHGIGRRDCDKRIEPVSSQTTGRTYSNMDCAIKNNEQYLTPWDSFVSNDTIKFFFHPENILVRFCDRMRSIEPISRCSKGSQNDQDVCDLYYYPVSDANGTVYQNTACYICNGGYKSVVKDEGYHPLRVLTRFSEAFSPDNKVLRCLEDEEWMDTIEMKCRRILCFEDAEIVNKTCQVATIDTHMKYFAINIRLMFLNQVMYVDDQLLSQILGHVFAYVSQVLHTTNYSFQVSSSSKQPFWEGLRSVDYVIHYVKCWFQVTESVELLQLQRDIDKNLTRSHTFGEIYLSLDYVNNVPTNTSFQHFYQIDPVYLLCCRQLPMSKVVNEDKYAFISEQLTCPSIQFDSSEYRAYNLSVYIPHLNISLDFNQYQINLQQKLVVCVNDIIVQLDADFLNNSLLYTEKESKLEDLISWYLTIVCITSSLLCLTASFITFLINPELRTLPGKTNMILILALFLAQVMLLSGVNIKNPTLCKAVGIIIHYLWLTTIFWMHVCSFHMFKVFVLQNLTRSPSSGHLKHVLKYAVYANGFPGLIIIITIITNLQVSNGTEIGYGGIVCYLTSRTLILYSFVIPLIMIIISNIIFFIFTIISIQRVQIMGRQTGGERCNVYIYIKLSVVTGLFWIVALLAETFNSPILEYISIILNGSQGVFLFVAFTVNRNVLRLWKTHLVRLTSILKTDLTSESNSTSKTNSTVIAGSIDQKLSNI